MSVMPETLKEIVQRHIELLQRLVDFTDENDDAGKTALDVEVIAARLKLETEQWRQKAV